jgi:tetratricopeptide (TPR) repeat protein
MTNLSFCDNRRIRKKDKILNAVVKAVAIVIGAFTAVLAIAVFLSSRPLLADASHQQKLVKQLAAGHQNRYELKVRESLELQKEFGNPALALQTLDSLSGEIEKKIRPRTKYNKREAVKALKVIGGVLKEHGKFEYRKNMLLIEGLKRQKDGRRFIDCNDYSSIYLFTGERLGLSLEPVYTPQHVFLMCRVDDRTSFYWEPTIDAEKGLGFYKNWLKIPEGSCYPKILTEKEFEATHLCKLGVAWYEKGDYDKAIEYFKKSIILNTNYAAAFNNLGVAYAKKGSFDLAIECYKEATSIDSNYATAFNNMGVAFYKLGFLPDAVECFEKAIEADPDFDKAYSYKVVGLIKNGEHDKALKFVNKIRELKQKNSDSSVN